MDVLVAQSVSDVKGHVCACVCRCQVDMCVRVVSACSECVYVRDGQRNTYFFSIFFRTGSVFIDQSLHI